MSELTFTEPARAATFFTRLKQRLVTTTRSRYSDFLPEAQAIATREASPIARVLIFVIAALFAILLFWAGFSEVEQVATAPAVVRPAGKIKIVNHPDGGRVTAIYIREGEQVVAGQKLIEFDRGGAREEIARRAAAWHSLTGEAARLEAEATGGALKFPAGLVEARPDIVRTQTGLYKIRRRALGSRRDIADKVIEQRDREAGGLAARLEQLGNSLEILTEQEKAVGELADKGYFPRLRYLSIKRQISELKGNISETEEATLGAFSALSEARSRRNSIDDEWRSEALGRLADVRREVEIGRSALLQEQRRRRNLILRAPTAGVVQNLTVTAPGQSVAANEAVLNIIPNQDRLIIEAQVSNDDIGYVRVGQTATIKVQTYDFIRFGALTGVVEYVAADATEDKRTGVRTFSVLVRAERTWLSDGARRLPINPGMQVSVDLRLGQRSILSYLTDRLNRTAQSAFHER